MKPTKKRLKDFIRRQQSTVLGTLQEEQRKREDKLFLDWVKKNDPELVIFNRYREATKQKAEAGNALLDLLSRAGIYTWVSKYSYPDQVGALTDENYIRDFARSNIRRSDIPGRAASAKTESKKIDEIRAQYEAICRNIELMPVKESLVYLEGLGFDLDEFKVVDVLPPLVIVDVNKLVIPKKE